MKTRVYLISNLPVKDTSYPTAEKATLAARKKSDQYPMGLFYVIENGKTVATFRNGSEAR